MPKIKKIIKETPTVEKSSTIKVVNKVKKEKKIVPVLTELEELTAAIESEDNLYETDSSP